MTPVIWESALLGIKTRKLVFFGPILSPVTGIFSLTVAVPVFVKGEQNDTFGWRASGYQCGDVCYNASSGETFW